MSYCCISLLYDHLGPGPVGSGTRPDLQELWGARDSNPEPTD